MLNLNELQSLLTLNAELQEIELNKVNINLKRVLELQLHRTLIKDCMLELLNIGDRRAA